MAGPLEGLRVVELSHESCAWAGKLLADLGAETIVVEPPGGSAQRGYGPWLDGEPGPERSLWWWHYNTNKRSVVLDLASDAPNEIGPPLAAEGAAVLVVFQLKLQPLLHDARAAFQQAVLHQLDRAAEPPVRPVAPNKRCGRYAFQLAPRCQQLSHRPVERDEVTVVLTVAMGGLADQNGVRLQKY